MAIYDRQKQRASGKQPGPPARDWTGKPRLHSAASKKGWKTRRAREKREAKEAEERAKKRKARRAAAKKPAKKPAKAVLKKKVTAKKPAKAAAKPKKGKKRKKTAKEILAELAAAKRALAKAKREQKKKDAEQAHALLLAEERGRRKAQPLDLLVPRPPAPPAPPPPPAEKPKGKPPLPPFLYPILRTVEEKRAEIRQARAATSIGEDVEYVRWLRDLRVSPGIGIDGRVYRLHVIVGDRDGTMVQAMKIGERYQWTDRVDIMNITAVPEMTFTDLDILKYSATKAKAALSVVLGWGLPVRYKKKLKKSKLPS